MNLILVYIPGGFWRGNLTGRYVNPAEIESITPKLDGSIIHFKSGRNMVVTDSAPDIKEAIKQGKERIFH